MSIKCQFHVISDSVESSPAVVYHLHLTYLCNDSILLTQVFSQFYKNTDNPPGKFVWRKEFETYEIIRAGSERVFVSDLPAESVPARGIHGVAVGTGQRGGGGVAEPGSSVAGKEAAGADGRRGHEAVAAQFGPDRHRRGNLNLCVWI